MCFLVSAITIIVRMDAYAILYGLWLGLFLRLRRRQMAKIWIIYFVFLVFVLPIQYGGSLGLPLRLCYRKPVTTT